MQIRRYWATAKGEDNDFTTVIPYPQLFYPLPTTERNKLLLHLALSCSFSHKGAQAALRSAIGMNVMKKLRMVIDCPRKQTSQVWAQILISGGVVFGAGKPDT